jgi:dephospho-CoA kinase
LLAQIAFGDPRKLRALNAIIHPSVLLTLRAAIAKLPRKKRYPYVVVEAALIFEALLEREFDCIILIETPLNLRLRRTQRFTREDLRRRSRLQLGAREKRKKSHFIISNSGSVQELRDLVGFLDLLLQISPEKPVFTNL